jgi:predicted nucleic acid-binding protein
MIVVDTSVLIFAIRGQSRPSTDLLRHEVDQSELLVGDVTLLEVLRGARDEAHARKLEMQLRRFMIVSMLGEQTALAAAANYRRLRSAGVTMSKLADLIIGTYCIENGHRLLADDRDFSHMATHLGLRLARPRHLDPK